MAGIWDDFKELADQLRTISGPSSMDIRQSRLIVRTRTWAGGFRGSDGGFSDSDLTLPQIYHFRPLKASEIASSGGRYEMGDMKVGPITPSYPGTSPFPAGGFTEAQLKPRPTANGVEIIYVLDGAGFHAGEYNLVEMQSSKSYSFFLVLRRTRKTP